MDGKLPVLLMVDDSAAIRRQLKWSFSEYQVVVAGDRQSAIDLLRRHEPKVMTLDLGLPPHPDTPDEGFKTLEEALALLPGIKVIALTGQSDRSNAIRAIALGAHDFVEKPIDVDLLSVVLARAFKVATLEAENQALQSRLGSEKLPDLITNDPSMAAVCEEIRQLAPANATVLLYGESGTGKELLARALHTLSSRTEGRFIAINCAAIPEALLESELFGYERGAFTGANKQVIGKFELANNGTLFLDEIGDLPSSLQAKLLRFLQERTVERLGGRKEIPVNVRVVCATHQDLHGKISQGEFREDLFYRIAEVTTTIPPLRHRVGDKLLLANLFLKKFGNENSKRSLSFSNDAIQAIDEYAWPGNVRELESCIKRACILTRTAMVTAKDLSLGVTEEELEPEISSLKQIREEAEKKAVIQALAAAGGNVSQAAKALAVSRQKLYHLMERYQLR